MSDETEGRTSYSSAAKNKKGSGSASKKRSDSASSSSHTRREDDPSLWARSPGHTGATARTRTYRSGH